MSYRRQRRNGGRSVSLLLLSVALLVLLIGFLCLFAAIYFTSMMGSIEAPADGLMFGNMLMDPFVMLFQGGAVTLVGGGFLTICGGFMMIFSS